MPFDIPSFDIAAARAAAAGLPDIVPAPKPAQPAYNPLSEVPAITLDSVPVALEELLSCDPSRLMATLKRDNTSAVKDPEALMQLPLRPCFHCIAFTFARSVCEVRNCRVSEPGRSSRCVFFRPLG